MSCNKKEQHMYRMGENDNLIIEKLIQTDSLGIFGYSFLDENRDKAMPTINGVIQI